MEKEKAIKKCIICKKDNSKYKCPNCKNNYCSINCFNEHKKICIRNEEKNNKIEDNLNSNKPLNLDEDEDIILEKKDLEKLKENKKIMNMLKNNTLRKIIREIDSAKYKKRTLERMINNDKNFKEFVQDILITLGFIKDGFFTIK
jgi:hypothetical protein